MPPKRAAAVCRGQLTLFQCAAKKHKQSIDPTEDSKSELASQKEIWTLTGPSPSLILNPIQMAHLTE